MLDNLKIKSMLLSERPNTDKTGWDCYSFYVVITNDKDTIVWDGKFHVGTGHAKYYEGRMIVDAPKLNDIIHSLLMDGSETNFIDFCNNFGYSRDSIKSRKIFRKCMRSYKKLVSYFGQENMAKLHEMFQDY